MTVIVSKSPREVLIGLVHKRWPGTSTYRRHWVSRAYRVSKKLSPSLQYRLACEKQKHMLIDLTSVLRTFAILYTYTGENPFDLGWPLH